WSPTCTLPPRSDVPSSRMCSARHPPSSAGSVGGVRCEPDRGHNGKGNGMRRYVTRRLLYMIPTLFAISIVAFLVIQLPPGNFLTVYIAQLSAQGQGVDGAQIHALEERYGLNDPLIVQYWKWISGIVTSGDFGQSFQYRRDVATLIWDRIGLTLILAISTLFLTWALAFPIGIYSAVRQYSIGDYVIT